MTRVCVAGAGAIGSLFAGHLAQVCDVVVLTRREEHARALREQGLRVSGRSELRAELDATTDPAELGDVELVIVACKGPDLEPVAALTGLPHVPQFADETERRSLGHLVHGLIDEGKRVAAANGVELHDDPWEMNVLATKRGSAHYPSMLEDVESARPTEVELINGSLVRAGERAGVPVPLQNLVYRLVQAREAAYPA